MVEVLPTAISSYPRDPQALPPIVASPSSKNLLCGARWLVQGKGPALFPALNEVLYVYDRRVASA